MTDYKKSRHNLIFNGVPHRVFINNNGDMVIRYNECYHNYTDEIFDGTGTLKQIIDVQDGHTHIQQN